LLEKRLCFSFSEFEVDPPGVETFVRLSVEARSGLFSGESTCVVRERDLMAFLDRVQLLATASANDALLVGGWGKDEHVRVEMSPAGRTGHLSVRVMLSDSPDLGHMDRLDAFFRTEPAALRRFGDALRGALAERREANVNLYVVGGSAV
jgi:hypothetical protein